MNARTRILAAVVLGAAALAASHASAAPQPAAGKLHPDVALLDADGVNVLASGKAVSTMNSCGRCHDTDYIASHAFHADLGLTSMAPSSNTWDAGPGLFGRWDPLRYRYLSQAGDERLDLSTPGWLMFNAQRVVGGGPATTSRSGRPLADLTPGRDDPETSLLNAAGVSDAWNWSRSGTLEMDCFVCHLAQPDMAARTAAIRAGRFADASTATLVGTKIVQPGAKGWAWNRAAFNAEGLVDSRHLGIQDPTNANCAACHGQVHEGGEAPLLLSACDLDDPQTATTGQVVSSQRINASGVNLAGKDALHRSWDVHAERQLQCTDCHYALNNPARAGPVPGRNPSHLQYDPRTLDIANYLQRPDHDFARGTSARSRAAPGHEGTMRRCENCHDAATAHARWLPYLDKHMAALSCESCHIPKMYAPAIQSVDWTVVTGVGQPVRSCRGVDGEPGDVHSLVTGFEPVLVRQAHADGTSPLAPYNLITTFYWVYVDAGGRERPVRQLDLQAAFLEHGAYAPAIVAAFDADHDGSVGPQELRIDSPRKQAAVEARFAAQGLRQVRMEGRVQAYGIHHDVARGVNAIRDCKACHASSSRLSDEMALASFAPVLPAFDAGHEASVTGDLLRHDDGSLSYRPATVRDHLYVFGASRLRWVDALGALAFIGAVLGVSGHGALRYLAWRRRPHGPEPTRRVRMYDAYRRMWHWLQAITIVALLLTGLVIHQPALFAVVPFAIVVSLHNVLAAILVANAALSLFYHLATERMREYIPQPHGFIDDAVRQAKYYVSGIFKGEPHPFEKRPDNRMNPIQKLTYFGILNVLLPLQIATGALMWGAQQWPQIAGALGGLPLLGPLHSLVAWLFASFIVGHVYLTTTGVTPLEAIRGMVTGYEEVEEHAQAGKA